MFGGRELLLLLEVKGTGQAPDAVTDVEDAAPLDAAPEDDEDAAPVVLLWGPAAASPGGRNSVVEASRALPIRTPRASVCTLPIRTALSPTSSTSRMLLGMSC